MEDLFYFIYLTPMRADLGVAKVNEALALLVERFFYLCAAVYLFSRCMMARRNPRYCDPSYSSARLDDGFEVPVRYVYRSVDIYNTAFGGSDLKPYIFSIFF